MTVPWHTDILFLLWNWAEKDGWMQQLHLQGPGPTFSKFRQWNSSFGSSLFGVPKPWGLVCIWLGKGVGYSCVEGVGAAHIWDHSQMMLCKTWGEGKKPAFFETPLLNLYLVYVWPFFWYFWAWQTWLKSKTMKNIVILPAFFTSGVG